MSSTAPGPNSLESSILVATLQSLEAPHFLSPVISSATTATDSRLLIVLLSHLFDEHNPDPSGESSGISHTEKWDQVQSLLTSLYVQATKVAQDMGKVLLQVDIVLKGIDRGLDDAILQQKFDALYQVEGGMPLPCFTVAQAVN